MLVLTCHEGNCHSHHGNTYARMRVDLVRQRLELMGYDQERLVISTLASNMGSGFAQIVNDFEKKILSLGTLSPVEDSA